MTLFQWYVGQILSGLVSDIPIPTIEKCGPQIAKTVAGLATAVIEELETMGEIPNGPKDIGEEAKRIAVAPPTLSPSVSERRDILLSAIVSGIATWEVDPDRPHQGHILLRDMRLFCEVTAGQPAPDGYTVKALREALEAKRDGKSPQ